MAAKQEIVQPDAFRRLVREARAAGTRSDGSAYVAVQPRGEVPEKSWLYRLAKRYWFNDFGVYRGRDHSRTAAPGLLRRRQSTADVPW